MYACVHTYMRINEAYNTFTYTLMDLQLHGCGIGSQQSVHKENIKTYKTYAYTLIGVAMSLKWLHVYMPTHTHTHAKICS